jgi:Icc-related predicted phosphoesterase
MRLVIISDTHSYYRRVKVPDGDVLINCGDISWRGELSILEDYAKWSQEQMHKHKLTIFGNHEIGAQYSNKRDRMLKIIRDAGIVYLQDSSIEIDGIHFYGSPFSCEFGDWEFPIRRGKEAMEKWATIPVSTNVLITHGPPFGIHDLTERGENVGDIDLLARIDDLRKIGNLRVWCGGHIHEGYAQKEIDGIRFVNASICDRLYDPINKPVIIDI